MKKTHQWDYDNYPQTTSDTYAFLRGQCSQTSQHIGSTLYYTIVDSDANNHQLYQITLQTGAQKKNPNIHPTSFAVAGDWIYFSNDTDTGRQRIYKSKLDGTDLTRLTDTFADNLMIRKDFLYYTEGANQVEKQL